MFLYSLFIQNKKNLLGFQYEWCTVAAEKIYRKYKTRYKIGTVLETVGQ